jgi:hypothetical protein
MHAVNVVSKRKTLQQLAQLDWGNHHPEEGFAFLVSCIHVCCDFMAHLWSLWMTLLLRYQPPEAHLEDLSQAY